MSSYQIYGHYYHWSDQSKILQNGLFIPGSGFPKGASLIIYAIIQLCSVMVITSFKVVTNDRDIHYTMAPIADSVVGTHDQTKLPRSVRYHVRQQIRPMVAIARLISMTSFLTYFSLVFTCFLLHIKSPLTIGNLAIICLWSMVTGLFGKQATLRSIGLLITMETLSKHLKLSTEHFIEFLLENGININFFCVVFKEDSRPVNSVRRFNHFLKVVIGIESTFLVSATTLGTFILVSSEFKLPSLIVLQIVIFCWIAFTAMVVSASKFSVDHQSDEIEFDPIGYRTRLVIRRTVSDQSDTGWNAPFEWIHCI